MKFEPGVQAEIDQYAAVWAQHMKDHLGLDVLDETVRQTIRAMLIDLSLAQQAWADDGDDPRQSVDWWFVIVAAAAGVDVDLQVWEGGDG